jgi:uncharacterized metal-binding protein YceD (DUF177 family)
MRIHIKELNPDLSVHINGTEAWLERIYADFANQTSLRHTDLDIPRLSADLELVLEEAGTVRVKGRIQYAPIVDCSRCALGIPWAMKLDVDARFLPAGVNVVQREKNLSRAELDAYYLEDNVVDLESLINDAIHGALPLKLIATTDDGANCRICNVDLTEPQVYGTRQDTETSPFAALKGLKLPQ